MKIVFFIGFRFYNTLKKYFKKLKYSISSLSNNLKYTSKINIFKILNKSQKCY